MTSQAKQKYTAVVIDLYSRQVVGWSMAERMKTKLVNNALIMAIWKRKLDKACYGTPTEAVNTLPTATENCSIMIERGGDLTPCFLRP